VIVGKLDRNHEGGYLSVPGVVVGQTNGLSLRTGTGIEVRVPVGTRTDDLQNVHCDIALELGLPVQSRR